MTNEPSISVQPGAAGLCVASGPWTAAYAATLEKLIDGLSSRVAAGAASIDMRGVEVFDTYGAWLLQSFIRERAAMGAPTEVASLAACYRDLFVAVQEADRPAPITAAKPHPAVDAIEHTGRAVVRAGADLLTIVRMLGAVGTAFAATCANPRSFRFTSAVHQLDRVGLQAVPIIILITFLIGGIIAQQGFFHFRKFGAELYVVDMLGILILREYCAKSAC